MSGGNISERCNWNLRKTFKEKERLKENRESYLKRSKEKKGIKRKKERKNFVMKIVFI